MKLPAPLCVHVRDACRRIFCNRLYPTCSSHTVGLLMPQMCMLIGASACVYACRLHQCAVCCPATVALPLLPCQCDSTTHLCCHHFWVPTCLLGPGSGQLLQCQLHGVEAVRLIELDPLWAATAQFAGHAHHVSPHAGHLLLLLLEPQDLTLPVVTLTTVPRRSHISCQWSHLSQPQGRSHIPCCHTYCSPKEQQHAQPQHGAWVLLLSQHSPWSCCDILHDSGRPFTTEHQLGNHQDTNYGVAARVTSVSM